jgi:hypothetical protein
MYDPGIRVGAILGADKATVEFLGYGIYEGDFPFGNTEPTDPVGDTADKVRAQAQDNGMFPNPRIRLDSGSVVWGCECWWGPEDQIKGELEKYQNVVTVNIDEVRKRHGR